jgi:hypothetical protein
MGGGGGGSEPVSPNDTWGRGGSKIGQKSVTYYLNGPISTRLGLDIKRPIIKQIRLVHPFFRWQIVFAQFIQNQVSFDIKSLLGFVAKFTHFFLFFAFLSYICCF